jgi:ATP-dependent Lon protease
LSFFYAKNYLKIHHQNDYLETHDLHIHVKEHYNPIDNASTGVAFVTAFLSQALKLEIPLYVAIIGEVVLNGQINRVEDILEKVLAAKKEGLRYIILPEKNQNDVKDLDSNVREGIEFVFVDSIRDVVTEIEKFKEINVV